MNLFYVIFSSFDLTKYFPQHCFLAHPQSPFFSRGGKPSYVCKTWYKVTVSFILMLRILDRKGKGGTFWTEWLQLFPELNVALNTSWIYFWFVAVVHKHFDFGTLSKDFLATLGRTSVLQCVLVLLSQWNSFYRIKFTTEPATRLDFVGKQRFLYWKCRDSEVPNLSLLPFNAEESAAISLRSF